MDKLSLAAFADELEKIAKVRWPGALAGAGIVGGVIGTRSALKEWERRDKNKGNYPETLAEEAKLRAGEAKRFTIGTGIGATGGAVAGHYTAKGIELGGNSLKADIRQGVHQGVADAVTSHGEKAGELAAKGAGTATKDAIKKTKAGKIWKTLNTPIGKLIKRK
jgi:hypothetical protein